MITDYTKTPTQVFVQEDDDSMMYGINKDSNIRGMVKFVREDLIPNEKEMMAFADKMTFTLDDRLCPYSREELRSRSFLLGMEFAKRNREYPEQIQYVEIGPFTITLSDFCERFSHNNEVYVENKSNCCMSYRYNDNDTQDNNKLIMDWELQYTDISDCNVVCISNVLRDGNPQGITIVIDTDKEDFSFDKTKVRKDNSPVWLYEKVHEVKLQVGDA